MSAITETPTTNSMEIKDHKTMESSVPQTTVPFPWKLHEMLQSSEQEVLDHIVSWLPSENGFKVHDSKAFVSTVLPKFFRQTKYKSFQRQCNIWGFERLLQGPHKGGYTHVDFIRGKNNLCSRMKRQKIKGSTGIGPSVTVGRGLSNSINNNNNRIASAATRSISLASYHSSNDSVTDAARSISPSSTSSLTMPIVEARNYYSPDLSSSTTKSVSQESLMTLKNNNNVPDLVHTVPVSPLPESNAMDADTSSYEPPPPPPQTGDSVIFEGQNFFFIHDAEFAATTNYIDDEPRGCAASHRRRLSLDLFAASRLGDDNYLVDMLIASDSTSPSAQYALTSSSYFY
jgi:HSF-type DNA-binding